MSPPGEILNSRLPQQYGFCGWSGIEMQPELCLVNLSSELDAVILNHPWFNQLRLPHPAMLFPNAHR